MAKYEEISEKERHLREILRSARLIAGSQIEEKGGLKRDEREGKEELVINL